MDHTGWVVVLTINILQAIAPTAMRRQFLFWNVRHRLMISRVAQPAGEVAALIDTDAV